MEGEEKKGGEGGGTEALPLQVDLGLGFYKGGFFGTQEKMFFRSPLYHVRYFILAN